MEREDLSKNIQKLREKYPFEVLHSKTDCVIVLANGTGRLTIVDEVRDYILGDEVWHEHIENAEEVVDLLSDLFTGRARVVIKYLGEAIAGHQLQIVEGNQVKASKQTFGMFVPFWRKKMFEIIRYEGAIRTVERTELRCAD